MALDIYEQTTARIIAELEKGNLPWKRPWNPDLCQGPAGPMNPTTGASYHGINTILLGMHPATFTTGDPRFCTYRQAQEKGWQIRKGETAMPIVFFKQLRAEGGDDAGGLMDTAKPSGRFFGMLRVYSVFHVGSQMDGAPLYVPPTVDEAPWKRPEAVATIIANSGAKITTGGDGAFYSPATDHINLPPDHAFNSAYDFAATAMHEMIHWTGAKHRLAREIENARGSIKYAKEELRAELGSVFVGSALNLPCPIQNHAAYLDHWLQVLKSDKREIFHAASEAQKATDYLLKYHPEYALANNLDSVSILPKPQPVSQPQVAYH